MLTLKPGLPSRCILAHPRVLCALFLCLSFRSCATFSLSLIYVCWTVGPLFNIILQRSVHVYHTATSTKGIGLFEDQFVWKVPAAKARVFRSASVNDLRRAFCTLPVKMTLQATNASLAIRFCWRAFNQDNRAEAKGERWEWRHRRRSFAPPILFQPWQQLLILPGLSCVWSGIKPENRKTPWTSPISNSLSCWGKHPTQPPYSMQVFPMMLHLRSANGLPKPSIYTLLIHSVKWSSYKLKRYWTSQPEKAEARKILHRGDWSSLAFCNP